MQKGQYRVRGHVFAFWAFMAMTLLGLVGCAAQPGAHSNVQPIDARTLHVTTKAADWGIVRTY